MNITKDACRFASVRPHYWYSTESSICPLLLTLLLLLCFHPFFVIDTEPFGKGLFEVRRVGSDRMFSQDVRHMMCRSFTPVLKNLVLVRRVDAKILVVDERIGALQSER